MIAVTADLAVPPERRVDPHHWADALRPLGWTAQMQPGFLQADGVRLPSTTHLTVTPITESRLPELVPALVAAADQVRGVPPVDGRALLEALGSGGTALAAGGELDSATAWSFLQAIGLGSTADAALPGQQAPLLALIEALPTAVAERLLIEKLARLVESPLSA
jgi:hypothetical protein